MESFIEQSEDKGCTDLIVADGNPLMLANNSKCSLAVNASQRMSNWIEAEEKELYPFQTVNYMCCNVKMDNALPVDRLQSTAEYLTSRQCFEQIDHKSMLSNV